MYRRSRANDADAVFKLVTASVKNLAPHPYSQEVVNTWMDGRSASDYHKDCSDRALWIAEQRGKAIGFSHGVVGEIVRLFADVNFAGSGVGAELMQRAMGDANQGGVDRIRIDATLNAVPFYQKWGFKEIGRGIFSGRDPRLPPIDVVLMEKEL